LACNEWISNWIIEEKLRKFYKLNEYHDKLIKIVDSAEIG